MEGKGPDGKERASTKKPKGTAGNAGLAGGKVVESGKATSGSGNDGASQRCAVGFLFLTIFRFFSSFYICSIEDFLRTLPCYLTVNFLLYSGESGSEGSSDGSDDNANNQVCMCITAN